MLRSVSGNDRSLIRGSNLEFAQYRKYVPGDDTRRMDWRNWVRSEQFYIREYEADTNLRLFSNVLQRPAVAVFFVDHVLGFL